MNIVFTTRFSRNSVRCINPFDRSPVAPRDKRCRKVNLFLFFPTYFFTSEDMERNCKKDLVKDVWAATVPFYIFYL